MQKKRKKERNAFMVQERPADCIHHLSLSEVAVSHREKFLNRTQGMSSDAKLS